MASGSNSPPPHEQVMSNDLQCYYYLQGTKGGAKLTLGVASPHNSNEFQIFGSHPPLTYTIMAMSKYTTQPQTSAPRSPHFVVSSWTRTSPRMWQGKSLTGQMHKEKCNRGMNTGCRVTPPRTCRLGYSYLSPCTTSTSEVRESSSTSATSTTQGKGARKEGITSPELPSPSQNAVHSAFFHLARGGQTLATECRTTSVSTHTARHHLGFQTQKTTTTSVPYQLRPIPSGGPRLQEAWAEDDLEISEGEEELPARTVSGSRGRDKDTSEEDNLQTTKGQQQRPARTRRGRRGRKAPRQKQREETEGLTTKAGQTSTGLTKAESKKGQSIRLKKQRPDDFKVRRTDFGILNFGFKHCSLTKGG